MKKSSILIAVAIILMAISVVNMAHAEEQRYAEPQMGWVSVAQASVRLQPNLEDMPIAQLKNGSYLVILGKTEVDGNEYFLVDGKYLGYLGETGYVLKRSVHLGLKEYVKMTGLTWAYAQESVQADGVASISAGQERLVLGETVVNGEPWLAIQVDPEGDRGVGYVRKADVSDKFVQKQDETLLAQVRAGSSASLPASSSSSSSAEETKTTAASSGYVTVSEATQVLSSTGEGATVLGTLQPGEKVYVYQVGSTYTMVVYNNNFGYVENSKIK